MPDQTGFRPIQANNSQQTAPRFDQTHIQSFPMHRSLAQQAQPHSTTMHIPYYVRRELLTTAPKRNFNGDPLEYKIWEMKMKRLAVEYTLSHDETIDLLELHTGGAAFQIVSRFRVAAGFNADTAVMQLWTELYRRFGGPATIARTLQKKLEALPVIGNDMARLVNFYSECEIVGLHMEHIEDLLILNYTQGLAPLFQKLPMFLKSKWQTLAHRYSEEHAGNHPPFAKFCEFLGEQSRTFSNSVTAYTATESYAQAHYQFRPNNSPRAPYISTRTQHTGQLHVPNRFVSPGNSPQQTRCTVNNNTTTFKTHTNTTPVESPQSTCPLHPSHAHPHTLANCFDFKNKKGDVEKMEIVRRNFLCFRCLEKHPIRDGTARTTCSQCASSYHHSLL